MSLRGALVLAILAQPTQAMDLAMPLPAEVTYAEALPLSSHRVAIGPWDQTTPFETIEGSVTRQVWKLTAPEATPLQILAPLRAQLDQAGFDVVFACETRACGGFDFRFDIDVRPAPEMFVDLAAYRYLAARKDTTWTDLVVSTSAGVGYVQQTTVGPVGDVAPVTLSTSNPASPPALIADSDVAQTLQLKGRAVLGDLTFPTGSTDLPEERYPSLTALADFLRDNPQVTVALVGHTDAEGSAEGNMAISRARAESARAVLMQTYGISGARIGTHGVGFFAPMARNDTEVGRQTNRRVEVVITSTP
ncbi:membrane protein [Jannaschia pagri]|uniref:Membrane protein n=1 Tax=Jannaschia pagri TaxID=2829797 RepID=A0ABQ4NPW7_9RHOB|nr:MULTISPECIES: OmpA family protein [unclassified Jannaschia]GIT92710.1 membrane protein [Jannaschia sp. AI_61]GIT96430.1 membrane protein [Jannaschia sp. AI_62]